MEAKELKEILKQHKSWIIDANNGKRADLSAVNLRDADLLGADLRGAILFCANLNDADLRGADLRGADLCGADLYCADLSGADLSGAKLNDANLHDAVLSGAKNVPFVPMLIPEGECIVWKKIGCYIIKLKLLEDSKRSRATTEKCRCDKALVIDIQNIDGSPSGLSEIENNNFVQTIYKVGEIVCADSWDEDRWNECSHGIHFFIDRQSAVNY